MDRYSATTTRGGKYVIVPLSTGEIRTYLDGVLVDDRASTVKEAKRNVNDYLTAWE
jgi:hypothetical protein